MTDRAGWGGTRALAPAALVALLAVCGPATAAEGAAEGRPVQEALEALREEQDGQVPAHVLEAGRKGNEELRASGILERALNVGGTMPEFTLNDAHGNPVRSGDLLARGPIVLVFYRGAWCPFCNLYLRSLQEHLPKMQALGATLVAVSGENPDRTLSVEEKNELTFTVLSDPQFEVARKFGIVFAVPKVVNDVVRELGFNMAQYYGTEKAELPLPATYVVNIDGKIAYAFLEVDYKKRAEPADILDALRRLRGGS